MYDRMFKNNSKESQMKRMKRENQRECVVIMRGHIKRILTYLIKQNDQVEKFSE